MALVQDALGKAVKDPLQILGLIMVDKGHNNLAGEAKANHIQSVACETEISLSAHGFFFERINFFLCFPNNEPNIYFLKDYQYIFVERVINIINSRLK